LAGGGPSGGGIERGTTPDGDYVRFADGTQICEAELDLGPLDAGSGTFVSPWRHGSPVNWTFPLTFDEPPRISLTPFVAGGGGNVDARALTACFAGVSASAVTAIRAQRLNANADTGAIRLHAIAIGRWV
jgi:hypothetical protein